VRSLLRKAKLHLNLDYITELVLRGKWEKIEKRLNQFVPLAFTENDKCTNELLSLIKRQRFLHMLYTYGPSLPRSLALCVLWLVLTHTMADVDYAGATRKAASRC
jgi:hypothetical protein